MIFNIDEVGFLRWDWDFFGLENAACSLGNFCEVLLLGTSASPLWSWVWQLDFLDPAPGSFDTVDPSTTWKTPDVFISSMEGVVAVDLVDANVLAFFVGF